MRIVKLKGGLGNQMFQYAFAKVLEKNTGDTAKLDFSAYKSLNGDMIRVPRIKKFNIVLETANEKDLRSILKFRHEGNSLSLKYKAGILAENLFNRKYYFERNRAYVPLESIKDYKYYDGYWQSFKYVDDVFDEISKEFSVKPGSLSSSTKNTMKTMDEQNSVFVGVRKGDYTADKKSMNHYGNFDSVYYKSAMDYISARVDNPVFYVFSNDIPWCKDNIDWGNNAIVYREPEEQTDDFEELILMSSCKHAVIVNSTYHWWGAKLIKNPDKIVCCPQKWFFDNAPIDIVPDNWVKIDSKGNIYE